MTLSEVKDQVAREYKHKDFKAYLKHIFGTIKREDKLIEAINERVDKATKLYAQEKVKEALRLAAESAEVIYHDGTTKIDTHHKQVTVGNNHIRPNRGKILSLETELLNKIEKEI